MRGKFVVVLAEAMDRLSRDQEDIAGLFKRMAFGGVRIVTLSEGDVTHLHVGLKGTMNALFLKDLADKTRRGLRGRVEDGKSGGGLCFGYDVVKRIPRVANRSAAIERSTRPRLASSAASSPIISRANRPAPLPLS
ncbi:recombinase family protein [Mesorhizobium sp. M1365]|uniref:recombinase family protein n=1 Tax=Mesorhizobium sp. M1365 TaxID=2957090 RepID=UPI00333AB65D